MRCAGVQACRAAPQLVLVLVLVGRIPRAWVLLVFVAWGRWA